jgi:hypothetical protein
VKVETDDDVYRAKLVYLGPTGYTFPVQWPYQLWALLAVVITVVNVIFHFAFGSGSWGFATGLGAFITYVIWRQVNPDRPVRAVFTVMATDWRRVRHAPDATATPTAMTTKHIQIGIKP